MASNALETTSRNTEIAVLRKDLEKMGSQFQAALPKHIPLERFERVVMTAIQNNQDLRTCDRASLFNACIRAAQDGLLPDGREGAIVAYAGKAQWMPMVFGLRKKARNSGEIIDWDCQVVFSNDDFRISLGDHPKIDHDIAIGDRGVPLGAYSIAHLKDGGTSREWMSVSEIEAIRIKSSRAKKGPWHEPEFYTEMMRKTVARRHSKNLPMSSDLDDLIRADDHLYDTAEEVRERRPTFVGALDRLAEAPRTTETINQETGEVTTEEQQGESAAEAAPENGSSASAPTQAEKQPKSSGPQKRGGPKGAPAQQTEANTAAPAADDGDGRPEPPPIGVAQSAPTNGKATAADESQKTAKLPANSDEYIVYARSWFKTARAEELQNRWKSPEEKGIRNKSNIDPDRRDELYAEMLDAQKARIDRGEV